MKIHDFEMSVLENFGNNVSIIYPTNNRFYVVFISRDMHKMDVKSGQIITYKTVKNLMRYSKTFRQNNNNNTVFARYRKNGHITASRIPYGEKEILKRYNH